MNNKFSEKKIITNLSRPPIHITSIEAAPLFGESPKGGWHFEKTI